MCACVRACVRVCACARVCARARVCACVCECHCSVLVWLTPAVPRLALCTATEKSAGSSSTREVPSSCHSSYTHSIHGLIGRCRYAGSDDCHGAGDRRAGDYPVSSLPSPPPPLPLRVSLSACVHRVQVDFRVCRDDYCCARRHPRPRCANGWVRSDTAGQRRVKEFGASCKGVGRRVAAQQSMGLVIVTINLLAAHCHSSAPDPSINS